MQSYLGFDWPAAKTVDCDKFRDANAFRTNSTCQAPQVACESSGTVQSTITFDEHELIHAYVSPSGRAPALFDASLSRAPEDGDAGDTDVAVDAAMPPPGNPFTCGDASCVTGQTYCRIRSGSFTGPDGGELPPTYSCRSLCSADDCSCVTVNQGDTYCQSGGGCEKTDAGAVIAHCGPV